MIIQGPGVPCILTSGSITGMLMVRTGNRARPPWRREVPMERIATMIGYGKALPAALLFIALFLPYSSCQRNVDEAWLAKAGIPKAAWDRLRVTEGTAVIKSPAGRELRYRVTEYNYIYKNLKPDLSSLAFLFFFIWPLPLVALQILVKRRRAAFSVWALQLPAGLLSLYYLLDSLVLTTPEIGAYLAIGSTAALLVLWIGEAVLALVRRRRDGAK